MTDPLVFRPISLAAHFDDCIRISREIWLIGFGTLDGYAALMGDDHALYRQMLVSRIAQLPSGNCHLWQGDDLVGQLEMSIKDGRAYVHCFYLAPALRGQGRLSLLHEQACLAARSVGLMALELSVSPANVSAIRAYEKLGWRDAGIRPDRPELRLMRYTTSP
ncbi:GNAT family N-acetyltransferase [Chitinimonas sp. BJYL2]|uniref:GNAT family N-acetyltransferase n=1 Tax=Chitinimonas sp. BJYL2 TaxID=2976696 RepID=UPI0022B47C79|nr:GNAT family N-acetyltransferase [Chitinimonas sp. BJYL2]